jgi:hypothetical protein
MKVVMPAGPLGWFDTGVKCLQRRDAWSVHEGIQEGMCDWAEMRLWLGSLFKCWRWDFERGMGGALGNGTRRLVIISASVIRPFSQRAYIQGVAEILG